MAKRRSKPKVAIYLIPGLILGLCLSAFAGWGALRLWNDGDLPSPKRFEHLLPQMNQGQTTAATTLAPLVTEEPSEATSTPSTAAKTTAQNTTMATTTAPPEVITQHGIRPEWTDAAIEYPGYDPLETDSDWIVPVMQRVEDSYFDDAVFIGNSIVGLQMLAGSIQNATYYCKASLQVESYFTEPINIQNGQKAPLPEALQLYQYKKAYLMLGVNEMSWPNWDAVIDLFDQVIKNIKETQPDAIIYVQSVLPVEMALDRAGYIPNNKLVQKINAAILELCEENEVWFLNVAESIYDHEGALPADSTKDGTHFGGDIIALWDEYLRTHAIPYEIME